MLNKTLLVLMLVFFTFKLNAIEDNQQIGFPTQLIEDAKIYACTGGNILKKPCALAGAIPGATVGLIGSLPVAFAASAIIPVIHLGSGHLLEASKSLVTAPINMLYLGSITGANWGMLLTGSSGYLAGAGLGTATALAKNVVSYSGFFTNSSEEYNHKSSNTIAVCETEENPQTLTKYQLTIKNNIYLKQCEQALIDFIERKPSESNDVLVIEQDWEYTVALAHDCLRDQYKSFIGSEEYKNLGRSLSEQVLKLNAYETKIEKLKSQESNTKARIELHGSNPRLEDILAANAKHLSREEPIYRELLNSVNQSKERVEKIRSLEEDIIYFRNLILEELKNSGINQSLVWPHPLYFNL